MPRRPGTLQEELRQNRPFGSVAEEATVAVLRTAALLKRALNRRVEPHGISLAQYNVLRILRGAGEEGLPTLAVRDRLIEEAPGITRLIDKLEGAGFVVRVRSGEDRRTVRCRITASGLRLLDDLDEGIRAAHQLIVAGIPEAGEQRRFVELLGAVREAVGEEGI